MRIVVILACLAAPLFAAAPDAKSLLETADRARGGLEGGLTWGSELETVEDGETSSRKFEIKALGNDALAISESPARNKGEVFLFNDRTMWFYRPGLRKPVGISPRQKLSGQAANGDIATTRYARDYDGKVVGEETVGKEKAYRLELKAKGKNVTYDQIHYWIGATSKLGIKAEYLSLDGKPLKIATFEYANSIEVGGKKEPFVSKMVLVDAKTPANRSTMIYHSPAKAALSAALFNVNNMGR